MELNRALRIGAETRLAFVGAGGKTTAMFRAARQVRGRVMIVCTAHLAVEEARLADRHFVIQNLGDLERAGGRLVDGINLFTAGAGTTNRLSGLSDELILGVKLIADRQQAPLLIEADGSRRRPVKAPAAHEPPIPAWVNAVVVVAGLSALGKPLNESAVFRSEIFSQLSGRPLESPIQFDDLCRVLIHPAGGLKNIPEGAEKILLINQLDAAILEDAALQDSRGLLLDRFETVLLSSLLSAGDEVKQRLENVAGIILAAGKSERFGQPKQLLAWKGKPFIQHIVEAALQAGLSPVVLVLGAVTEAIKEIVDQYPIIIVNNVEWANGQASSIAAGVRAVDRRCGAAVFLLSDMPQVSVDALKDYQNFHRTNDYSILAPRAAGQPANPAMFDRRCFLALMALRGEAGGRQLFSRFPVTWHELEDPFMALDIDTLEDYQTLLDYGEDDEAG